MPRSQPIETKQSRSMPPAGSRTSVPSKQSPDGIGWDHFSPESQLVDGSPACGDLWSAIVLRELAGLGHSGQGRISSIQEEVVETLQPRDSAGALAISVPVVDVTQAPAVPAVGAAYQTTP